MKGLLKNLHTEGLSLTPAVKSQSHVIWLSMVLGAALGSTPYSRADTMIDNLNSPTAINNWTFSKGGEFCCAQGSLVATSTGYEGTGAKLSFSMSGKSQYVAAYRKVTQANASVTPAGIALKAKSPPGVAVKLRVIDASNQTLLYNLARPLSALKPDAWYQQGLDLSRIPDAYWGGTADGIIHPPIKQIGILAEPLRKGGSWGLQAGAIEFDVVAWIDSNVEYINPGDSAILAPGGQESVMNPGVVTEVWDQTQPLQARLSGFTSLTGILEFWAKEEKTPGVYDFRLSDRWAKWTVDNGVTPWFRVLAGNVLYTGNTGKYYPPTTPTELAAFANYARKSASAHAGYGVNYTVWNEPNEEGFWTPTPNAAAYGRMIQAVVPAIREGDAFAKVAAGEIADLDWKFLRDALNTSGPVPVDAITAHTYPRGDVEVNSDAILLFRDVIAKAYGINAPKFMLTETGYDINWHSNPPTEAAYRKQAYTVVRDMLMAWSLGYPAYVHRLRVEGTSLAGFALFEKDWTPRPAADALRTLFDTVAGHAFKGTISTKFRNVHVLKFEKADLITLILWQDGGRFPWLDAVPRNTATVAVSSLPSSVSDFLGNAQPIPTDGKLRVSHEPIFATFAK